MNVKIALIQMSMEPTAEGNRKKAARLIKRAAKKGANIICLPEIFTGPYFCQTEHANGEAYAEEVPGPTVEQFSKLAQTLGIVIVGGSVYEKEGANRYNTAFVIDADGTYKGKYRKMHIPQDPSYYEQNYFKQGDLGFQVFETRYGKLATLICYDQWFPEAARSAALMGAEIIFYPTAIGTVDNVEQTEGNWQTAWEAVQRGHAVANAVVVATVNRVGKEGEMNFWGGSFIYDQFGTLKAHAKNKEKIVMAEVDLELQEQVRKGWRFFLERRPSAYEKLVEQK